MLPRRKRLFRSGLLLHRVPKTGPGRNKPIPLKFQATPWYIISFYPADPVVATGTSVIICPGGGFCYLHIKTEGTEVAKWLNKKGVSAFILKYRVVHSETSLPVKERMQKAKDTAVSRKMAAAVAALAIEDAKQAMLYVRRHANEFGIAVNKIGLMGFSAGGTLVAANSFSYTNETRPDFIVPVYAYVSPVLLKNALSDAPPAFIVAATDDDYHLVPMSIDLYNRWLAAGRSAEIHIYSKGGHGFGMNKLNQPSDTWIERLGDWLEIQGLLKK
jgi:acetyl esterase/lipase